MIVLVGCSSPPDRGSGILSAVREQCRGLRAAGHEVHLAAPSPSSTEWLDANGIGLVATELWEDQLRAATRVLSYVRERGIQGIINNDNPVLQSIAPALTVPFVAVGHFETRAIGALACFQHEWTDYVVAISEDMQGRYVRHGHVPPQKCPIVYNGLEPPASASRCPERRTDGKLRLVFAGGNSTIKGADRVLEAVLAPATAWRGIELHWYGTIPGRVRSRIAMLPHVVAHDHVPRERLGQALADADALLFPSRDEGCPMLVLEAMSVGAIPIVSDGRGAMRSMIVHGESGYVCSLADWTREMLEIVAALARSPDVVRRVKAATRERFLREFHIDGIVRRLVALLQAPTVDRSRPQQELRVLRWHRPARANPAARLADRICYRIGHLRVAGQLRFAR